MVDDCKPLLRAIADALVFLEFVPDDELDPAVAVLVIENVMSRLMELEPDDRDQVIKEFEEVAEEYRPFTIQVDLVRAIGINLRTTD